MKAWLKDLVRNLTGYSDDRSALARFEERMAAPHPLLEKVRALEAGLQRPAPARSEPHWSSYASARLERLRLQSVVRYLIRHRWFFLSSGICTIAFVWLAGEFRCYRLSLRIFSFSR